MAVNSQKLSQVDVGHSHGIKDSRAHMVKGLSKSTLTSYTKPTAVTDLDSHLTFQLRYVRLYTAQV